MVIICALGPFIVVARDKGIERVAKMQTTLISAVES